MRKRFIAAILMLAMSGAGAFAQTFDSRPLPAAPSTKYTYLSHVHRAGMHSCCRPATLTTVEIVSPAIPGNMPCGGQHSCCLRSAPANSPDLPMTRGQQRLEINRTALVPDTAKGLSSRVLTNPKRHCDFLSYTVFSTILRI